MRTGTMRQLLGVWALVVCVPTTQAAQFDTAAIQKWGNAKVVHYQIVGAYHAQTPLAPGKMSAYGSIEVTDTVTLEFDWDVRANAVVGEAQFTIGAPRSRFCRHRAARRSPSASASSARCWRTSITPASRDCSMPAPRPTGSRIS